MSNVLVTGFTPFDGRQVNASWVAASSLQGNTVRTAEIPVVWGAASKLLRTFCDQHCPGIILCLGEGREGWFDIETLASNKRKQRPDNNDRLPQTARIDKKGPAYRKSPLGLGFMQRELASHGYPARLSTDAGQFLCEEALYTLIELLESHPALRLAIFCHVPPFGTTFRMKGQQTTCDGPLLGSFARLLIDTAKQKDFDLSGKQ